MKLLKNIGIALLSLLAAFYLVACSSGASSDNTARFEQVHKENQFAQYVTYTHEEGKITSLRTTAHLTYSTIGASDKAAAKELFEQFEKEFTSKEGVTFETEFKDTSVKITFTVDYANSDHQKLVTLSFLTPGLLVNQEGELISNLEECKKLLLEQGFTAVEKGDFTRLD